MWPFSSGTDELTDADDSPDSSVMVSRIIKFKATPPDGGERKIETFYSIPDRPKDLCIWEDRKQLEHEGSTDIEFVSSEIGEHNIEVVE